jgi:hypothetical protein
MAFIPSKSKTPSVPVTGRPCGVRDYAAALRASLNERPTLLARTPSFADYARGNGDRAFSRPTSAALSTSTSTAIRAAVRAGAGSRAGAGGAGAFAAGGAGAGARGEGGESWGVGGFAASVGASQATALPLV